MLKVVEDEAAIRRHQRLFARQMRAAGPAAITVRLGHPGASEKAKVAWSEGLGVWFFARKIASSRYWNAFGVGRPEGGSGVAITCEINFPLYGIDRRTGGAFAQDRSGRVFVVHRGKLGGGRLGIGKSLFENAYRGVWEVMADGGEETPVALIGVLDSPRFSRQIAQFVRKIARIKDAAAARSSQAELTLDEFALREELIGAPFSDERREAGAECDRGLAVRDLADALRAQGLRSGNDGQRDLMAIDRSGRLRAVFQVVTDTTPAGIHAAATELLLAALDLPDDPLRILVLPSAAEAGLGERLRRLGVATIACAWQGQRADFAGLDALLPRIAS